MTPVRLEPATLRSRVKHSTTEPLRSLCITLALSLSAKKCIVFIDEHWQSKKEGKDQESIQSSTTPDPGYQWESDNVTIKIRNERAKRSALSKQETTMHQQTDAHESITKEDRNIINDPQKNHRLGNGQSK